MKLSIEDVRIMVEQLEGKNIIPKNTQCSRIFLENWIVWFEGFGAIHPSYFLDEFGAEALRNLPRDCSKHDLDIFIKNWEGSKNL